jgi:hypothetical protein
MFIERPPLSNYLINIANVHAEGARLIWVSPSFSMGILKAEVRISIKNSR